MTEQKVWLITGCDSGMGRIVAETVLEAGGTVVATALDASNIADLAAAHPGRAHARAMNVTDHAAIARVVAEAEATCGGIDVLVNCAGFGLMGAVEETTPEEYRPMFEVNYFGTAETIRAVLPGMRARRSGNIFNVSSSGGYEASPGMAHYAASKYAVEGLSDALARECAAFGIKVTILEPGSFRTAFAGANLKRAAKRIEPYHTESAMRLTTERMNGRDGVQPNDPRKLARILMQIVAGEMDPPMRLPLGADSIDRLQAKAKTVSAEFERLRPISLSVAFDAD